MPRLSLLLLLVLLVMAVSVAQDEDPPAITVEQADNVVQLATLSGHLDAVRGLAFSPDSNYLASVGEDLSLRIWHIASAGAVFARETHAGIVVDVAFGPTADDGWPLVSVGWDRVLNFMRVPPDNPAAAELVGTFESANGALNHVAFSPDGKQVAVSAGTGTLFLVDAATYSEIKRYTLPTLRTTALAFNPDGTLLAVAPGFPETEVLLVDIASAADAPLFALEHTQTVTGLAFAPEQTDQLVTTTDSGDVNLWALGDTGGTLVGSTHTDATWYLNAAFHPSGEMVATASLEGLVQLWDVRDPQRPQVVNTLDGHDAYPIYDVAFSPDGTLLASAGGDGNVVLWGLPQND